MAFSDMQTVIADELSRTDLTTQIIREINNACTFYQNKRFWFSDNVMVTINTISGQRYYKLPPNFGAILECRAVLGNLIYSVEIFTEQYLDRLDWTNQAVTNYIEGVSMYNGKLRVYPPPVANIPIHLKGTVILPALTTTAATKSYARNTAFTAGDTILDQNGNIQTAKTSGTTAAATTNTYTANTAYTANQTVIDGNGNIQTCTTAGISGYILAVDPTGWSTEISGITSDGSNGLTWTLTAKQWSTDYLSFTVDGSVTWQLTTSATNAWMVQAEELIRTRACRMIYQRYIKDTEQSQSYAQMEREALNNLYEKNYGQSGGARITPYI